MNSHGRLLVPQVTQRHPIPLHAIRYILASGAFWRLHQKPCSSLDVPHGDLLQTDKETCRGHKIWASRSMWQDHWEYEKSSVHPTTFATWIQHLLVCSYVPPSRFSFG